jgi:hypothetical protein
VVLISEGKRRKEENKRQGKEKEEGPGRIGGIPERHRWPKPQRRIL